MSSQIAARTVGGRVRLSSSTVSRTAAETPDGVCSPTRETSIRTARSPFPRRETSEEE